MTRKRAQQNLINNWVSVVLTIVGITQGFAFNYLVEQFPNIFQISQTKGNHIVLIHFLLCFVILLRISQTFVTAVLDYDFVRPKFFEIFLVPIVGVFEFYLFSSLKLGLDSLGSFEVFSPLIFHKRAIFIAFLAAIGYLITLFRLVAWKSNIKRRKGHSIHYFVELVRRVYKPPKIYAREVRLQKINVIGLLLILIIEAFSIRFSSQNWTLGFLCSAPLK